MPRWSLEAALPDVLLAAAVGGLPPLADLAATCFPAIATPLPASAGRVAAYNAALADACCELCQCYIRVVMQPWKWPMQAIAAHDINIRDGTCILH